MFSRAFSNCIKSINKEVYIIHIFAEKDLKVKCFATLYDNNYELFLL